MHTEMFVLLQIRTHATRILTLVSPEKIVVWDISAYFMAASLWSPARTILGIK